MQAEWILFSLILVSGFYMAWNIGANDVANAMGTSVGSGALTLKQALVVAAILEFSGAFFFGSHVSETIQNGIIDSNIFVNAPTALLLGMLSCLIGTGIWLQLASYFGWPVSTTHTIVGALIGFALFFGGIDALNVSEVLYIAVSWIISPLLGAFISYLIFQFIRSKIFFSIDPLKSSILLMPKIVFFVFAFLTLILLLTGLDNVHIELPLYEIFIISFFIASVAYLITKSALKNQKKALKTTSVSNELLAQIEAAKNELFIAKKEEGKETLLHELEGTISALEHSKNFDDTKEDFIQIEKMFGWLQILSACLMAFAHGANDVANAIGPLSAALFILKTGSVALEPTVPSWALALGGAGIVIGLATWGWRVIETIGKKITELTPTRGFSAEFGAAVTILMASFLGLPISTTHTLVGAVIGVGLARGIGALNLGMTRDILLSWIITIPAGAIAGISVFKILSIIFLQ